MWPIGLSENSVRALLFGVALSLGGCEEPAASPVPANVDACDGVVCGDGAACVDGACSCEEGLYGDPNVACLEVAPHEGWVGSTCDVDLDCDYDEGVCLLEAEGFPGGYCSAPCSLYCDDMEGAPMTFCVGEPEFSDGYCLSRCDVEVYPETDGCRPGYACVERARNTTDVTEFVCLPTDPP